MSEYKEIIEEIMDIIGEGECIDADGYHQLTLPYAGNPNDGVDFRPIVKAFKNKKANEKRRATRAANKEKKEIADALKRNTPVNSLGLAIKDNMENQNSSESLSSLFEEIINEISNELANKVHDKRIDNVRDAQTKEEIVDANDKLKKNLKLMNDRDHRKEKEKELADKFREFYKDYIVNPKQSQEAGDEHANAQITQGLRNKLEKIYALEPLVEEFINETSVWFRTKHRKETARKVVPQRERKASGSTKLAMHIINKIHGNVEQGKDIPNTLIKTASTASKQADIDQNRLEHAQKLAESVNTRNKILEEIAQNVLGIFEGDVIDFDKKKKAIETQKERDAIANEVNNMMASGETRNVRQTSTGNLIGNPDTVKKLYGLRDRLKKLCGEEG